MEYSELALGRSALATSVHKTLANTFWTVGVMLALLAVSSVAALGLQLGLVTYLVAFVASIGLIFATHFFKNSAFGLVLLAAFALLQGVTLGPLLSHYLALKNGALLVGSAAGLTAVTTFACAAYAIVSRRNFSQWGGFLFGGLIVLILASILALFVPMPALHLTISAVGALLFTAYLMYHVGRIVNGEETNYITASLAIFLDVLNLFLHLLRLLGLLSSDD